MTGSVEEDNVAVAQRFIDCVLQGDVEGAAALVAPEFRVWAAGDLASAGWHDRDEYIALLTRSGGGSGRHFAGRLRMDFGATTAQDDRVCIEAESRGALAAGGEYNNQYHFLLRIAAGKVVEYKEYMDTAHVLATIPGLPRADRPRTSNLSAITSTAYSTPA